MGTVKPGYVQNVSYHSEFSYQLVIRRSHWYNDFTREILSCLDMPKYVLNFNGFFQDIAAWWIKIASLKNFGSPGWNRDERLSRTGTQSHETVGIGTKICGTSGTGTKSCGTVPHGCPAGQAGPGRKKRGTVPYRPLPIPGVEHINYEKIAVNR